jgi:hypothetical protein
LESHETKFRRRMRREIERLRAQTERLEGREKDEQIQLIEMLENHMGTEEEERFLNAFEQEQAWASIILILNTIEHQVRELQQIFEVDAIRFPSPDAAQHIVDQFSYDCQEAEKLTKFYERKGHLTREQRAQLETQLRTQVETMMALFRRSDQLTEAVMRSFTAQLLSA